MKYVSLILACCVAIVALSLPGFASSNDDPYDGDSMYDIPTGSEEDPYNQNVEDPEPVESEVIPDDTQSPVEEELPADDGDSAADPVVPDDTGTEVSVIEVDSVLPVIYDVVPVEVTSRSSLMDAIVDIFGVYRPRTYQVSTYLEDGTVISSEELVPGLAGVDWEWIAGVGVFCMSLYCIFRMIGGMFKWK